MHRWRRFGDGRFLSQIAILLHQAQMIESTPDHTLETTPIHLEIFGCINACLIGIAQRLRAQGSKRDDQDIRPPFLHLLEEIADFPGAQIKQKQGRPRLLEDNIETIRVLHVS
jgi:hypothetical protein